MQFLYEFPGRVLRGSAGPKLRRRPIYGTCLRRCGPRSRRRSIGHTDDWGSEAHVVLGTGTCLSGWVEQSF